jgi:hypothetical protein
MIEKKRPLLTMMTPFGDVPEYWLRRIEPQIVRSKEHTCWIWQGAHDKEGEPVINFTNEITGARNTRRAKRAIADIFFVVKRMWDVLHGCGNLSCLNPAHFKVEKNHWKHR